MKSVSATEVQSNLEAVLDSAQKERVMVTRAGKPSVVIVGIESYDAEDLRLASSPEFWQMIEERRHGPSIPLAELKARLGTKGRSRQSPKANSRRRSKRDKSAEAKRG